MAHKNLLIVFTRNPELGKVKSRLAKGVGKENALEIYKLLLNHTKEVIKDSSCKKRVGYSVKIRENDIWESQYFEKFQQKGDDLGERMHNAFKQAFNDGFENVLIIGSDLFDLRTEHIETAFEKLALNDVVIGPAKDGGYYLLGMNKLHKQVFFNKDWGTHNVFKDTIADLQDKKISLLDTLNDIDYAEDLEPYPEFEKFK